VKSAGQPSVLGCVFGAAERQVAATMHTPAVTRSERKNESIMGVLGKKK
jgi:hypothetical protein